MYTVHKKLQYFSFNAISYKIDKHQLYVCTLYTCMYMCSILDICQTCNEVNTKYYCVMANIYPVRNIF